MEFDNKKNVDFHQSRKIPPLRGNPGTQGGIGRGGMATCEQED